METFEPYLHRIQNIEVRNCYIDNGEIKSQQSHLSIPPFSFFSIVKYFPNEYYGKENNYEWDEKGESAIVDNIYTIHKSCFTNAESNFTIASWGDISNVKEYAQLKFCGNRPFELDDTERTIFWKLASIGQEYIQSLIDYK